MTAQPAFFGPPDAPLFAWHHPASAHASRGVAVVLCPSIALDFMSAYRSLRVLAERLAASGFAVWRLEYRGTGNSWGDPREAGQLRGWEESIRLAAEEAARRGEADRVVLVGLRLGGTLAANLARQLGACDSLVLWNALPSGRAYLRELRALVALSAADGYSEVNGELSAAGFSITRSTAGELERMDLHTLEHAPAAGVLCIEEDDRAAPRRLHERFRELGSDVRVEQLPGTAAALLGANYATVPLAILDRITTWLEQRYPIVPPASAVAALAGKGSAQARVPPLRERAVWFGPDERLFGMLTEPALPGAADTAVVFLNTGANHHVGPHRMFVPLARDCASMGVPAFRFDFGGLGASEAPPATPENVPYPEHAVEDIRAAVAAVQRETGASRIVLAGLCSGGWHALAAARAGVPLAGVLAVNAPLYFKGGDPDAAKKAAEAVEAVDAGELLRYQRAFFDPAKWKKLLSGKVYVGTFLGLAAGRVRSLVRTRLLSGRLGQPRSSTGSELETLAEAGVPVLLVFDREDPSYLHFELHLPAAVRKAPRALRWIIVEGAGDTFKPIAAQERLRTILLETLKEWTRAT